MKKLVIDLGTTTIKCAQVEGRKIVKRFDREYPILHAGNRCEQDPALWWKIVCEGIRAVRPQGKEETAISVSTQGITVLPVDEMGEPLSPAISWLDQRAVGQAEAIEREFGEQFIFEKTGKRLLPDYTLPKILWLKKNCAPARRYVLPLDYLNFKLCGRYATDFSMASGTMLYDIRGKQYCRELLDFAGIDERQLAEVLPMGSFLGSLTNGAAEELDLAKSTKVFLGGQDQKLSVTACRPDLNTACVSVGTSSAISSFQGGEGYSVFRLDDDNLIYEASIATTGAVIKHMKTFFGAKSYRELDKLAERAGESGGVTFCIDYCGNRGAICGLGSDTSVGNVIYALYEEIANGINRFIRNREIRTIALYGGGANSEILCRILADVTSCEVTKIRGTDTALLGAADLIR